MLSIEAFPRTILWILRFFHAQANYQAFIIFFSVIKLLAGKVDKRAMYKRAILGKRI